MTSTEIVTAPSLRPPVVAGGKAAAFVPQTIEEAHRISVALARSGMTPKSYGSDPNKIMVGIMAGAEVGLTPFAALQSIAVIGNNPSLWGDGALAVVQASGLLEDISEVDDGNMATCTLVRTGRKTAISRSFSMEDAKRAGLAGKTGPWSQYPARMRQMRARAFALRDGFADVLKGLHIAEEVRDYATGGGDYVQHEPLTAQMLIEQAGGVSGMGRQDVAEAEAFDAPQPGSDTDAEPAPDPLDESPAEANLRAMREQIAGATNPRGLQAVEAEWINRHRVGHDGNDEAILEIEALFAARKVAMKGGK